MARPLTRPLAWLHRAPGQPRLTADPQVPWRRVWPMGLVGLAVAGILVGGKVGLPGEVDPTALFRVGSQWGLAEAIEARGGSVTTGGPIGYDGQWFLGLAYDPLVQSDLAATFHRPQYRAQRPFFSMAGWVFAAGQPGAIPYGLLAVALFAAALGCSACARLVTAYRRSRWWGLLFVAVPGVVVGLTYGTAEPLALALSVLGLSLVLDRRYAWAGLAFAGAALTKETYLAFAGVAAAVLVVEAWIGGDRSGVRRAGAVLLPGVAALASWWWYVSEVVPESQRTPSHLLEVPFVGWWRAFQTIARGEYAEPELAPQLLVIASFVLLVVALAEAVRLRQSLLAYAVVLWSGFGLSLVHIMLERFLSAQRVLAPAVFAAAAFLVTAIPARRRAGRPPGTAHSSLPAPPAAERPSPATSPGAGPG